MLRILFYFIILLSVNGEGLLKVPDSVSEQTQEFQTMPPSDAGVSEIDLENVIKKIESIAALAVRSQTTGIVPIEDIDKLYDDMIELLDEVVEYVKSTHNAYKFLKSKGIERVIAPYIVFNNKELRKQLLILMKILFRVAPTTTNAVIPINVVDGFLDIFENDDNLALKAHALDILYMWLPNNPAVQTRVMKVKGLEPFYKQISKLDVSVVKTLLDLFNKILIEHLNARDEKNQTNKIDAEKSVLYKRIGLLERMSTPMVCNGIYNVFEVMWSYNNEDNNVVLTVFELMKNIKPFCLKVFRKKRNTVYLFEALLKYLQEEKNNNYFSKHDVNTSDVQSLLEDYVANLQQTARDEF